MHRVRVVFVAFLRVGPHGLEAELLAVHPVPDAVDLFD
jgi:hypothetical protein